MTSQQFDLIHRFAPNIILDTKTMTRGDASRLIQLLLYKNDAAEKGGAGHAS